MAHKLRIPVARCPACGHVTRDFELIAKRCERVRDGARCRGVTATTGSYDEWRACPGCEATGRQGSGPCAQCQGAGWLYVPPA